MTQYARLETYQQALERDKAFRNPNAGRYTLPNGKVVFDTSSQMAVDRNSYLAVPQEQRMREYAKLPGGPEYQNHYNSLKAELASLSPKDQAAIQRSVARGVEGKMDPQLALSDALKSYNEGRENRAELDRRYNSIMADPTADPRARQLAFAERLQREQVNPVSGPLGGQRSLFAAAADQAERIRAQELGPRMLEGGPQQNPFMGGGGFGGYGGRQGGYGGGMGGYGPQQNPFMGGGGFGGYGGGMGGYGPQQNPFMGGGGFGGFGGYGPQQNPFMGGGGFGGFGGFGGYGPQQNPFMGGGGFGGYGPQQNPFMGGGGFGGYGGQQGGFGPQQNPFMGGSGFGGQQGGFGNQQSSGGQQGGFGQPQQQPISGFGAGQQGGFGNGFGGI